MVILAFDLNQEHKDVDRTKLVAFIEETYGALRLSDSVYALDTQLPVKDIESILTPYLDADDEVIVVPVLTSIAHRGLKPDVSAKLNKIMPSI